MNQAQRSELRAKHREILRPLYSGGYEPTGQCGCSRRHPCEITLALDDADVMADVVADLTERLAKAERVVKTLLMNPLEGFKSSENGVALPSYVKASKFGGDWEYLKALLEETQ